MIHTLAILLAIVGFASSARADTPALKALAQVTGDIVRVGDLMDNAGAAAGIAIFRAPDLGHTGSVPVNRVLDAVRPHGLLIVDTRGLSDITVARLSRSIGVKELEDRIASAFAGRRGLGDGTRFTIVTDRELRPLHLDPSMGTLKVARAVYDPATTRFDVTFETDGASGTARAPHFRFTGTLVETMEVAMLVRPLARGDVVRAGDVVIEQRPKAQVPAGALERADQLAGLAARRALVPSQPLRAADLMKPEIVRQNETVTVIYQAPGLNLTVRGKALEAGAEGDLVNVLNIQSKRTMQGAVTGPGRVTITVATPQAAAAAEPVATGSIAANPPAQRTE